MSNVVVESEMAEARRELMGQYGSSANAEELILAHRASISPEVQAAAGKAVNLEATKTLDKSKIDVPEGGKLIDAVVRANVISYVWEDSQGYWYKGTQAYDKSYESPSISPGEQAERLSALGLTEQRDEILKHQVETERKVAELRADEGEELQKTLAKMQEQMDKLTADLAKEQEKNAKATSSSSSRSSSSRSRKRTGGARASSGKGQAGTKQPGTSGGQKAGGSAKSEKQMDAQQSERKAAEG